MLGSQRLYTKNIRWNYTQKKTYKKHIQHIVYNWSSSTTHNFRQELDVELSEGEIIFHSHLAHLSIAKVRFFQKN